MLIDISLANSTPVNPSGLQLHLPHQPRYSLVIQLVAIAISQLASHPRIAKPAMTHVLLAIKRISIRFCFVSLSPA